MKSWTVWGVLILSGLASKVSADTDWCYKYLQKGDNDQAIEACTKELQSGKYDGEKDVIASRLQYRGRAYLNKLGTSNYDKAIADLSKSIALVPDDVSALQARGVAYLWSGRYNRAIDDFSRLLSIIHQLSSRLPYYQDRGIAYWLHGDNERALRDFTAGINYCEGVDKNSRWAINNEMRFLYELRGNVYYSTGDYEKAVADYAKSMEISIFGSYLQLRTWLALEKLSVARADEYREVLRASAKKGWDRNVVYLYLGVEGVTENDVLEEARREEDEMARRGRLCEAYYYLGEGRLLRGDRKGAQAFFAKSAAIEYRYTSSEKFLAKVLLTQMKKPQPPERQHNMGKRRWLPR